MKEGWEYKKLGDIGTFIRGGNFSKKDYVEDGFPCIHYGQIHMKFGVETLRNISSVPAEMVKNDRCAKKGDLVIAITSEDDAGSCKCTAWMGDYDVYVGGHTAIYRHTMQPKYVSYYFMSPYFQKDKLEYTHGFKVVEISPKDIAKISIPVPSLSEQQSIVDYLDSAFAKIDAMKANAEKALNGAKALLQASLKEMLEPKEGWEKDELVKVFNFIDYRGATPTKLDRGIPLITAKNVKYGFIDYTIKDFISKEEYDNRKSRGISHKGDILFTTEAPLGNVAIADLDEYSAGQRLITLQQYEKSRYSFINMFYYYYMLGPSFQKRIKELATGATALGIKAKLLKTVVVPIPPLSEQQTIVETLDSLKSKVDKLQANYDKISQECDALKQAILKQVFE